MRTISAADQDAQIPSEDLFEKVSLKGLNKDQEINLKLKMRQTVSYVSGAIRMKSLAKGNKLLTNTQKLEQLSQKVGTLSELAEESLKTTWEYEEKNRKLNGDIQDSQVEMELLSQRCLDLEATIQSTGKSKQQALASRLVSLSEEVRTHKLVVLQQRRQIAVLRQEKKHLQGLLVTMESDVEHLEEGKIIAETKGNLLLIYI